MIRWTAAQQRALDLMTDPANQHVMLYGGARSGKTLLFTSACVIRAMQYPKSRHLIARLRFSHAKASIWLDTLLKALEAYSHPRLYRRNESDHYVRFANDAELWIDGLDDKERVDKILGREYATIFFNEISQIPYDTVSTVVTRLAQRAESPTLGPLRPMAYYDLNPAGQLHWANQLFIAGVQPDGNPTPPGYAQMRINPVDNAENLPDGFIENVLERLPDHKRRRFLLGEWSDPEGIIFTDWEMVDEIPEEVRKHARHAYGLDFGFSVDPAAAVELWMNGDDLWVDELLYQTGLTNADIAAAVKPVLDPAVPIWADSAEPKSITEIAQHGIRIAGAKKGADSVRAGIDWLLSKRVHVTARSANIWAERANYCWRVGATGRAMAQPIDDYNHAMDAIRYGATEWIAHAVPIIADGVRF